MKRTILLVLLALLLAGNVLAQSTATVPWSVIGGGGGHAEAAPYALDGTIGQPVIGQITGPTVNLCSGFWCGAAVQYRVYLPLVLRDF